MTRDTRTQIIAGVLLLASLAASVALSVSMTAQAGRAKISYSDRAEEGQTWEVSVGIAMGAFRGIFVNFLWMRANDQKQEGKYYEAVSLAQSITRLQPRFPRVWVFHAWNLAYNISVSTQTKEERWEWVNAGVRLLRERGIPANPNDLLLHKELAWIFLHKIAGFTDDANPYYKKQMALEWTIVLGEPPAPTLSASERDKAVQSYVDFLTPIARAPRTVEELALAEPGVNRLLERLRDEVNVTDDFDLLRRYESLKAMDRSGQRDYFVANIGPNMRTLYTIMNDPQHADAWKALIPAVRRSMLTERYRMDPDRMIRYTQKYGPIDWRHPAAHGLYWSAKGVEEALSRVTTENRRDFDFVNTDRVVAQSVQELYRSGEVWFDFFAATMPGSGQDDIWQGMPSPHFVDAYGNILDEMAERSFPDNRNARAFSPLLNGYENFLKEVVTFFHRRGENDEAEKYFQRLRTDPKMNAIHNQVERRLLLTQTLPEFVAGELRDQATRPAIAVAQFAGALQGAYVGGLIGDNPNLYRKQMEFAFQLHKFYLEEQLRLTVVDPNTPRMQFIDPDFEIAAAIVAIGLAEKLSLDDCEKFYDRAPTGAPTYLREHLYPVVQRRFKQGLDMVAQRGGRSFEQIFPPPPDMEQFNARIAQKFAERERQRATIEQK